MDRWPRTVDHRPGELAIDRSIPQLLQVHKRGTLTYMTHIVILYTLLIVDVAIFIVLLAHILLRRRGTSETRLAWMVFIILVPYLGALIYLMGRCVCRKAIQDFKKGKHSKLHFVEHPDLEDLPGIEPDTPDPYRRVFTLAENMCQSDLVGGNDLELKGNTRDFLLSLCQDIESATDTVHLLTYIYLTDSTGRRVGDAASSRVETRGDLQTARRLAGIEGLPQITTAPRARGGRREGRGGVAREHLANRLRPNRPAKPQEDRRDRQSDGLRGQSEHRGSRLRTKGQVRSMDRLHGPPQRSGGP